MIIGIDGNEANVDKRVGVSVYTLELLKYFAQNASENTQFIVYLREPKKLFLPAESKYFTYDIVPGRVFWSHIFLPFHLLFHSTIDIFFAPAHYAPRILNTPLVLTIHDLSYFYYPDEFLKKDLYKLTNWTRYSIQKAQRIIAVSKTTKKDVIKWYQTPDERVDVVYNGFKKTPVHHKEDVLKQYDLRKKNYILYVGTLQPRKNLPVLIRAFAQFKKTYPDFQLVLAGKKGWLFDEIFEEVEKNDLQESVVFTGYETDDNLVTLYKNAFCFVLPSLYEGFGIPILEAMSHGCPVVSSHASSLPEVGGDACLYFDPTDESDLLDKLIQLQEHADVQQNLIQAGSKRVKEFSWEQCGKETLAVIQKTAST